MNTGNDFPMDRYSKLLQGFKATQYEFDEKVNAEFIQSNQLHR